MGIVVSPPLSRENPVHLATMLYQPPMSEFHLLPMIYSTLKSPPRYKKMSDAWRELKPPPRVPEEASRLVVQTLKRHPKADIEGLLTFYGLPLPHELVSLSAGFPSSLPQGVKYEMQTLSVDGKAVADGDTVTVYISTEDPRESSSIPRDIKLADVKKATARAKKNYVDTDALQKKIVDSGYRGIDFPESAMPYGKEAKEEIANLVQGKCLREYLSMAKIAMAAVSVMYIAITSLFRYCFLTTIV